MTSAARQIALDPRNGMIFARPLALRRKSSDAYRVRLLNLHTTPRVFFNPFEFTQVPDRARPCPFERIAFREVAGTPVLLARARDGRGGDNRLFFFFSVLGPTAVENSVLGGHDR